MIVDRDARVVDAGRRDLRGGSVAALELFGRARAAPDDGRLLIGPPAAGRPTSHCRLRAAAARAGGALAARCSPCSTRPGCDDCCARCCIRRTPGRHRPQRRRARARRAAARVWPGRGSTKPGSMFSRHRASGRPSEVMVGTVAPPARERMVALVGATCPRVPTDAHFVIGVSRRLDAVYALVAADHDRRRHLRGLASPPRCSTWPPSGGASEALERARRSAWRPSAAAPSGWSWRCAAPISACGTSTCAAARPPSTNAGTRCSGTCRTRPCAGFGGLATASIPTTGRVSRHCQRDPRGRSARFRGDRNTRHADGHWVWVFDRGQVLERDGQGARRVVSTHMDVTEATERQLALRANDDGCRHCWTTCARASSCTARTRPSLDANPAACRLSGLSLDQLAKRVAIDPTWGLPRGRLADGARALPVPQVLESGAPLKSPVVGVRRPTCRVPCGCWSTPTPSRRGRRDRADRRHLHRHHRAQGGGKSCACSLPRCRASTTS